MTDIDGYPYTLTRTFDVPADVVWEAWTTPDQYAEWANAVPGSVEMDVRPGGVWKAVMVTPEGDFPLTGSYLEVEVNERLVTGMDIPAGLSPRPWRWSSRSAANRPVSCSPRSATPRRSATWPRRAATCCSTA